MTQLNHLHEQHKKGVLKVKPLPVPDRTSSSPTKTQEAKNIFFNSGSALQKAKDKFLRKISGDEREIFGEADCVNTTE